MALSSKIFSSGHRHVHVSKSSPASGTASCTLLSRSQIYKIMKMNRINSPPQTTLQEPRSAKRAQQALRLRLDFSDTPSSLSIMPGLRSPTNKDFLDNTKQFVKYQAVIPLLGGLGCIARFTPFGSCYRAIVLSCCDE